jgi:asparagine synthase (glutamine-hydrolysing)
LTGLCSNISNIDAGSLLIKNIDKEEEIFSYTKLDSWRVETDISKLVKFDESVLTEIRNKLIESVKSHLDSDVPVGVLLSGGLDSSLVASIVSKLVKDGHIKNNEKAIKTFTIGVENSSDILAADTVATFLKSNHSAYNFEATDAITVLEEVIYAIETYDITTIRASIPLYLLTSWIKEDTDIKVILSGEVSDEIFAGYSYFKHAPSAEELFLETKDKVNMLQRYDCLRAHKATIANTIEIRIPFGDKIVVDYVMNLNPECKMYGFGLDGEIGEKKIEKYILRKAFDGWLPDEILWRKKEQFSDGVSSDKENVINVLKQHAENEISDKEFAERNNIYPINTPSTKEGLLYYKIFNKLFKHDSCLKTVDHNTKSVACSTERGLKWLNIDENNKMNDPSGHSV